MDSFVGNKLNVCETAYQVPFDHFFVNVDILKSLAMNIEQNELVHACIVGLVLACSMTWQHKELHLIP